MLITDLDFLKSIEVAEDVVGGDVADSAVSLSVIDGAISLKLGDTVLYEGKTELPQTISLSSTEPSFTSSSCTTQTVNGVTSSVCTLSSQPPNSAVRSFRKSVKRRRRRF
jgi:hypothetical protein